MYIQKMYIQKIYKKTKKFIYIYIYIYKIQILSELTGRQISKNIRRKGAVFSAVIRRLVVVDWTHSRLLFMAILIAGIVPGTLDYH
jgi:hypothetical protein